MKRLFAALALITAPLSAAPSAAVAPPPMPGWIAGAWAMQDGLAWADEFWTPPRGEIMIGAGREGVGGVLRSWESMRIQRKSDGSVSFFGQPRGAPAVEFPMVSSSEESVEFTNAAHDYPQRIRYWRQGNLLMAEVSKLDGSAAMRWNYRPMGQ